jgi:hypothetical protein
MEKKCNKCDVIKDVSDFGKKKDTKDGLHYTCKSCRNKHKRFIRDLALTSKQRANRQRSLENLELFKVSKKKCYKCKGIKGVSEFTTKNSNKDGLNNHCKVCILEFRRFGRLSETEIKAIKDLENKREQKREYLRKWREKNKEKLKQQVKQYQEANKKNIIKYKKKYKEDNKEKTNIHAKFKYKTDTLFRLKMSARGAIKRYIKVGKSKRTREIVGLDFKEFQDYLKVEYTEGMHLDHIIPLSWAINDEEVYTLNHYSNFQIITAEENLTKSDRYCKSENLKKVLDNHNDLTKLNKIIERNSDKIT